MQQMQYWCINPILTNGLNDTNVTHLSHEMTHPNQTKALIHDDLRMGSQLKNA